MTYTERMWERDWTGVFATVPADRDSVVVTCCHHLDNAFYELGVVEHEVTPAQLFAYLPTGPPGPPHNCATAGICWMLDLRTAAGLEDSLEVTAEQASELLGRDVWEALAVGRANLDTWVASSEGTAGG